MSKLDSDQSDSDNDQIINTGVLSVFRVRNRMESDDVISPSMFFKLKQSLTCPICLDIFNEPVYVKDCSHRFCKSCIEKYIRSQERKSCPTCRRKIGTKRQLRIDENVLFLMQTVFGSVEQYIQLEDASRKIQLEYLRSSVHELPAKRQRGQKVEDEHKVPRRGGARKKVQTVEMKEENIAILESEEVEIKDEIKSTKMEQEDEENFQKLKDIIDTGTPITITIQLHTHPESVWLPQIQQNVIRGPWTITTDNLSVLICRSMGLSEDEYSKYIHYFVSYQDQLQPIDNGTSLEFLEKNYWKYYRDAELYDPVDIIKKILEKEKLKDGSSRILFYNIDLECLE